MLMKLAKSALALLGAIVVGAAGSALWDLSKDSLLHFLHAFSDYFPRVFPFSRDHAFHDAAIASAAELRARAVVPGVIAAGAGALLFLQAVLHLAITGKLRSILLLNGQKPSAWIAHTNIILMNIMLLSWAVVKNYEWTTAAIAAREFEHRLKVCGPAITDSERKVLVSRYARITTEREHREIIRDTPCNVAPDRK